MPAIEGQRNVAGPVADQRPPAAAGGRADFADAVAMLDAGRERLASLCSHRVPLAEAERAWPLAADKAAGAIKVTVLP